MQRESTEERSARLLAVGAFLRTRRGRLAPATAGLPVGARRRTPGLRREEVAQLAGASVAWYTWLEQGREVKASRDLLERVADALKLDAAERGYFLRIARPDDFRAAPVPPTAVPAALLEILGSFTQQPAYVRDDAWNCLAWNGCFSTLFGDPGQFPKGRRNVLWLLFGERTWSSRIANWHETAPEVVARFRADLGHQLFRQPTIGLVERLCAANAHFQSLWSGHAVRGESTTRLEVRKGRSGMVAFDRVTLKVSGPPALTMIVHVPVPEPTGN
jgi:transcriptional regulator with XRE-family HTH domain